MIGKHICQEGFDNMSKRWNIERTKDTYHADKHIRCEFGLTLYLRVVNAIGDKHNPYRWNVTLFRDGRRTSYQMILREGRARTANDAKKQAEYIVEVITSSLLKNK